MPELIIHLALLSGSLPVFPYGDERLRCGAEHIRKVSLKTVERLRSGSLNVG